MSLANFRLAVTSAALAAAVAALPSRAEQYPAFSLGDGLLRLGIDKTGELFLMKSIVGRQGRILMPFLITNYQKPMRSPVGTKALSSMTTTELDCDKNVYRIVGIAYFADKNGEGAALGDEKKASPWRPLRKGEIMHDLQVGLCNIRVQ